MTEADKQSEEKIISHITKNCPSHSILSEEAGKHETDSDYTWIIDPLDGTTNYTHQYPLVCVSIGLVYRNTPIIGVIFNPIYDEMYQGGLELGATLNGKPIHVSKTPTLHTSLLATGFAYDRNANPDNNLREFCHITNITQGVRRGGAAALDLASVAAGRLDGFWESGLQSWDIAAGALLIKEAGGQITDYGLEPLDIASGRILATNGHIHQELSTTLANLRND